MHSRTPGCRHKPVRPHAPHRARCVDRAHQASAQGWQSRVRNTSTASTRRGVGGNDVVAGGDQFPGQQTAAAAKLEDQSAAGSNGLQQIQNSGGAGGSVEPEAAVVRQRQVASVVTSRVRHPGILSRHPSTSGGPRGYLIAARRTTSALPLQPARGPKQKNERQAAWPIRWLLVCHSLSPSRPSGHGRWRLDVGGQAEQSGAHRRRGPAGVA
jgi:hypothetical protein